jgi:hypothetical protein
MPFPIPGTLAEWVETSPTRWERTGHPENGVICVTPPLTFPAYYAQRALPTAEEILNALPTVISLRAAVNSLDGPTIDAWQTANANSLPEIRDFIRTLLKLLAARL